MPLGPQFRVAPHLGRGLAADLELVQTRGIRPRLAVGQWHLDWPKLRVFVQYPGFSGLCERQPPSCTGHPAVSWVVPFMELPLHRPDHWDSAWSGNPPKATLVERGPAPSLLPPGFLSILSCASRLPPKASGWTKSPKICDGGLSGILPHIGPCLWWVDLSERKVRLLLGTPETAHLGEVLSSSQPGEKLLPLAATTPQSVPPRPRLAWDPQEARRPASRMLPVRYTERLGQRSLLHREDGRAPGVISPALCSPNPCSLCKAQLTGRGRLNLTEVQGCLVGKVLTKSVWTTQKVAYPRVLSEQSASPSLNLHCAYQEAKKSCLWGSTASTQPRASLSSAANCQGLECGPYCTGV